MKRHFAQVWECRVNDVQIEIREDHGVFLVRLDGELTGQPEPDVVGAVTALFAGPGTRVLIDLGALRFMNSVGLSELVRITAQANTEECRVALVNPTPFVAGLFGTTQLDRFFEIVPTLAEALQRMRAEQRP
ncbi:MAG: STAS domain-containing protein [Phycisphaerales bacterium]|nr:STAS domain-containing protein [Phycisphaerales bacterium]